MAELAGSRTREARLVNEKHGDDHGVKLSELRAIAKRLKTQQELATRLWEAGETPAQLLAILICRPAAFGPDELDAMVRAARSPKVHDWLVNYVVKKSPHAEKLRLLWFLRPGSGGCECRLGADDRAGSEESRWPRPWRILDTIEAQLRDAPDRLQWAMNHCLAQIGIEHDAEHRARAVAIGERLGVLKDYPTPPGCTSPVCPHLDQRDGATRPLRPHGRYAARSRRRQPRYPSAASPAATAA